MKTPNIVEIVDRLETKVSKSKIFAQLDTSYTYQQLTVDMRRLATVFQEKGLKKGDRLLLASQNNYAISAITLACLRFGITFIRINTEVKLSRFKELVQISQPAFFFVDEALVNPWALTQTEQSVFKIHKKQKKKGRLFKKFLKSKSSNNEDLSFEAALAKYPKGDFPTAIDPALIAYILFTSGSTGTPKAVQVSHLALWSNLTTLSKVYELNENANIFNILPTHHTDGLTQGPILTALIGATWFHPMEFSIDKIQSILDAIYKYKISHFITIPTMLSFLLNFAEDNADTFDNEYFKYIITSASTLNEPLWRSFEEKFNTLIINTYGLTETVAGASYTRTTKQNRKIGSIGRPVDCQFKIVDDNEKELGVNQAGELLIKGNNLFTAYLNNEEATAAAFKDNWFCTGDIVKKEEDGNYYILGRKKNLIISGGINIHPEEVSQVIDKHPAILESACIGKADAYFGEKLVACVVLKPQQQIDELSLIEFCKTSLEKVKVPKEIIFLDNPLPKTASGKIKYAALQTSLENVQISKKSGTKNFIEGIFTAAEMAFKVPKIQMNLATSSQNQEGWDSMAHLVFITELETIFNIQFGTKEIMQMTSIEKANQIISTKLTS